MEFDVSSIKPNVSRELRGDTRQLPDGTYTATNISIHNLLPLAWPTEGFEYRNLPEWARRERYDVTVKPPPGASPAQIQEMWRALFKRRLRLEARNEVREGQIYALVLARADGRLGPQLKPSPHDCAALAAAAPVRDWDCDEVTCLRACVMKPVHREWMTEIVKRLDDAARSVLGAAGDGHA